MGKIVDIKGNRFGRLTVIEFKKIKNHSAYWLCHCDCGNEVLVSGGKLREGTTKSCGCFQKENASDVHGKNLLGKRFGKLLIINKTNKRGANSCIIWECVCDCGKKVELSSGVLLRKNGGTKSCGCLLKEIKDFTGMHFGRLTVIKFFERKNNHTMFLCQCDCGTECIISGNGLQSGNTKSCGCLFGESTIATELKRYFCNNYNAIKEYRILRNPATNYFLPYDIFIPIKNVFIEVNGKHHYQNENHFYENDEDFKYRKKLDRMKRKYARKHGVYIEIDLRKVKTTEQAIEIIESYL